MPDGCRMTIKESVPTSSELADIAQRNHFHSCSCTCRHTAQNGATVCRIPNVCEVFLLYTLRWCVSVTKHASAYVHPLTHPLTRVRARSTSISTPTTTSHSLQCSQAAHCYVVFVFIATHTRTCPRFSLVRHRTKKYEHEGVRFLDYIALFTPSIVK